MRVGDVLGPMSDIGWVGEELWRDGERWVQRFTAVTTGPDGRVESMVREVSAATREELADRVAELGLLDDRDR